MKLTNQNVLVIGGSSGIGQGIAAEALREGASVVLVSRSTDRLEAASRELAPLGAVRTIAADMTDEAAARAVFAEVPLLHHVITTAVMANYQPVREMDVAKARRLVDSKLILALLVAKYARFADGGSLTLTSGVASDRPGPGGSMIAAVNGATESFVRALSLELAPVRVNALSPGWVDTPFWTTLAGDTKADRFAAHAKRLPVGRVGAPADLATAALFLMTNGFTTGEVLHVDGGHRLV